MQLVLPQSTTYTSDTQTDTWDIARPRESDDAKLKPDYVRRSIFIVGGLNKSTNRSLVKYDRVVEAWAT